MYRFMDFLLSLYMTKWTFDLGRVTSVHFLILSARVFKRFYSCSNLFFFFFFSLSLYAWRHRRNGYISCELLDLDGKFLYLSWFSRRELYNDTNLRRNFKITVGSDLCSLLEHKNQAFWTRPLTESSQNSTYFVNAYFCANTIPW